ncbi:MAG TPA: class I SAM-dependent methyltransferase [Candidatus Saccharimonadales bacterium]|nr:class I SAM-dependent methyltransferase [Candidatus Saccharimonadales bacterium]
MTDNSTLIKEAFEQPQWYLQGTSYNIKLRTEIIAEMLGQKAFESILDIGCGDGSLTRPLLKTQTRLTLVDASQSMLRIACSRIPAEMASHVQTVNADFMAAELPLESFDLINCVGVLAYIERRQEFIAKIRSLLKPGGSLTIECTDGPHFINRIVVAYAALRSLSKPPQMRTIVRSSAEVIEICQNLGFRLRASYRYSLPLPLIRKLMTQSCSYRTVRMIFGTARVNRNSRLGNECIYHFRLD